MSTTSLNVTEIDWEAGRHAKREVDDRVFGVLRPWATSRRTTRMLTLPANAWYWEWNYARRFSGFHNFTGVERNPEVYSRALKRATKLSVETAGCMFRMAERPMSMNEFLQSCAHDTEPFDLVYLDWMGTWSTEKHAQVRTLFAAGLFTNDAYLRYTISLSRGQSAKWSHLEDGAPKFAVRDTRGGGVRPADWKVYGIPQRIIRLAREHGYKARVEDARIYLSFSKQYTRGVPEMSLLLKINK